MTDSLVDALDKLARDLESHAQKARDTSEKGGLGDKSASYFDGKAAGYEHAINEIQALIQQHQPDDKIDEASQSAYVTVSHFRVERILKEYGIRVNKMYVDDDQIITAILPALMLQSLDDLVTKLDSSVEALTVLEYGRIPETSEPYIDFAFTTKPDEA